MRVLHTQPTGGGPMAALTCACHPRVRGCSWLAGQAICPAQMAGGALRGYRNTGVEFCRRPRRVARLVARVAIGNSDTS
jgi:hypothetical protein